MILSDTTIREALKAGRIVIEPLEESHIQPSSVDLRVDRYFRVFRNDTTPYIDPKRPQEDLTELVEVADDKAFILHPGEFVLGSTLEVVTLPDDLVARLEGKSSLGRLGLLIHSSLPGSEPVIVQHEGRVEVLPIELVVRKQLDAHVVAFDPGTLEVGFHRITGWFEGPPDRIYEVRFASGRTARVTAGHNLFTRKDDGRPGKIRTAQLQPGVPIAVPGTTRKQPLAWDVVRDVVDTGQVETIFDLEVRPDGRHIENFVAGCGGVFVSNTAGFVDAGFSGHLTLELSNVANLPIAIYPGMKIGQISFIEMDRPAERPYGSGETGSKYQGQRGPTPSRYYLNFADEPCGGDGG